LEPSKTPTEAIVGLVVVVLLVIAATAVVVTASNKDDNQSAIVPTGNSSQSVSSGTSISTPAATTTNFKDGSYSAAANYDTPGGVQTMSVNLTISGNTVTDVSITQNATGREDEAYQSDFAYEYKSDVVGKKVSDISLSRVAGASLTTEGFNNALDQIKNQAGA
jgi:hypothetical protein